MIQFDPRTGQPLHPEALDEWMDRAAINAGWVIFAYLQEASRGLWQPSKDECEKVYPK